MPLTGSDIQRLMGRNVELYHSSIDGKGDKNYLFGPDYDKKPFLSNEAHSGIVALAEHLLPQIPVVVTPLGYIPLLECMGVEGSQLTFKEGYYHFRDGMPLSYVLEQK